jgi:hypothetical protein
VNTVSTKTRADVRAELLQAQREGYSVNIGPTYQDVYTAPASTKTRAEVKAEIGTPCRPPRLSATTPSFNKRFTRG